MAKALSDLVHGLAHQVVHPHQLVSALPEALRLLRAHSAFVEARDAVREALLADVDNVHVEFSLLCIDLLLLLSLGHLLVHICESTLRHVFRLLLKLKCLPKILIK